MAFKAIVFALRICAFSFLIGSMVKTLGELALIPIAIWIFDYSISCHDLMEAASSLQLDGASVLKLAINFQNYLFFTIL